jgi:glycosyltransferase involved in cell wall biosynthesis
MRISLISLNLVAEDAIGACMMHQVRFFRRRGDDVHVYTSDPCGELPGDIRGLTTAVTMAELRTGKEDHFRLSDLYIYHYPGYYELLESMREIDRGTVVFYYHNVTPPELWGSDIDQERLVQGTTGKSLVHYADLCLTPSPFNKQDLVDQVGYDADRISVLPMPVALGEFTPGEKDAELMRQYELEGQNVLLFVGRMAGNKRIDLLVEALALIKKQMPNSRLLLVGDNESSGAYRQITARAKVRAEELGIGREVIFTGRVARLPTYLRLADVYVTASLHEGFGVPLIEAMACGVPVVASRCTAMPWVVGDAGLLAEPGDAEDLAEKTVAVLTDSGLHSALVERGLERAQVFSLERYEARLGEIVDKAVTYTLPPVAADALTAYSQSGQLRVASWRRPKASTGEADVGGQALGHLVPSAIGAARATARINPHWPIAWPTWPKGLWPKAVALAQKVTRRLLQWYINPIVEQQNRFNAAVVQALDELAWEVQRLHEDSFRQAAESRPDSEERPANPQDPPSPAKHA